MQYRGYWIESLELDEERRVLHGRVGILGGGADFEADDAIGLIREFRRSVDVYLDACSEFGLTPGRPLEPGEVSRHGPVVTPDHVANPPVKRLA